MITMAEVTEPSAADISLGTRVSGFNTSSHRTSTSAATLSMDLLEQLRYLQAIYNAYNLYIPPILMIMGAVGNLLSLLILYQPSYRRTSTGFYMTALALADCHYVTNGLIHHYLRRNFGPVFVSMPFCRSLLFFLFAGSALSSWTLVLMTFDRMIAIVFPMKAPVLCTKYRAKVALSIAGVINVARAIPCLLWGDLQYSRTLDYWSCDLLLDETYYLIYYNEGTVVNQWLPFALLLLANVRILMALSQSSAQRKSLIGDTESAEKLRGQEASVTVMLLANTFAFLLFCLPYQADFIYWKFINSERTFFTRHYRVMTWNVAYLIRFLNPTVNFYIYLLSSSKFRREVKVYFLALRRRTQAI